MGRLHRLRSVLLRDGKITDDEVDVIRDCILEDGKLDLDDVKFLVELLAGATDVAPAFDELFFPVLKEVLLADKRIGLDEQFYLLKMLYCDGRIRDSERRFLEELRREVGEVSPEFESLCQEALTASATNWDVGGR